jgi:shikimate kinase
MRKRQETYEWSQKPTRPGLNGISGLVISAPFMMLEAGLKTLASTRPKLSEEEEQQVQEAMKWRNDRYAQLSTLFQQNQDQINTNSSCLGKIWNKTLDKLGSWRAVPLKDNEIFDQMIKTH